MTDQPKKRGRKPRPPLSDKHRDLVTTAVANGDPKVIANALAKANHTPALYNQKVSDGHLEMILTRLAAGEPVLTICEDLGLSAALVRKRAYDDSEFGERFIMAQRIAADGAYDLKLQVAYDQSIDVARAKLICDVLDGRAKTFNRAQYGDKVQVDHKSVVINLSKDDLGLA